MTRRNFLTGALALAFTLGGLNPMSDEPENAPETEPSTEAEGETQQAEGDGPLGQSHDPQAPLPPSENP